MQNKGGPRLLVTDREGAVYLERSRVHVEGNRVVYHITDDEHCREYNIPHVNLAVLFLGQGTSITQDAMRLLGEEGVHLAVTGSGGTPLHMGGLTNYTSTHHFREMLPIYQSSSKSLLAAKAALKDRSTRMRKLGGMYSKRVLRQRDLNGLSKACDTLNTNLDSCNDLQQLLGFEGTFAKTCYAEFANMSGLSKLGTFRRESRSRIDKKEPEIDNPMQRVNRLIDHGNYLCYGIAGAALWALGIPPHMSVFHGKTRAGGLVFDLADSFKDSLVLPFAFASVLKANDPEMDKIFRSRLISAFDDCKILAEAIGTVNRMIATSGSKHPTSHA